MSRYTIPLVAALLAASPVFAEEEAPALSSVRIRESEQSESQLPAPDAPDAAATNVPAPEEVAADEWPVAGDGICASGPLRQMWHCRIKPCLQESHWGYPEEFEHRPFGTYMRAAGAAQVASGMAAQLTLYAYDFAAADGRPSARLSPYGQRRLLRLADASFSTGYPIYIERDERQIRLNESRRQFVLGELRRLFPDMPESQVKVGRPATRALTAAEAVEIDTNFLRQIQSGPTNNLGSGSGSQSFGVFGVGGSGTGSTSQ